MKIKLYETDTQFALTGDLKDRYRALLDAESSDDRKPLSYAIFVTLLDIRKACYMLAETQGINLLMKKYQGAEIDDDGTIMALMTKAEEQLAARAAKIAAQKPAGPTYACANRRHGCPNRVDVAGDFCAICAHDEE